MILIVPGPGGLPERKEVSAAELAGQFWASSWGLSARLAGRGISSAMFTWLTSPVSQGGLNAAWDDYAGLREVRDHIISARPGGPSCRS